MRIGRMIPGQPGQNPKVGDRSNCYKMCAAIGTNMSNFHVETNFNFNHALSQTR